MLSPQSNPYRQVQDLSGLWDIRFDPQESGLQSGWQNGFEGGRPVAVPASWNDQFDDGRDFLGPAWYQTNFYFHISQEKKRIFLYFGSVNYLTHVWLNGQALGMHEGGHLPFEFDVTSSIQVGQNQLVVRVDGRLAFDRVPPGNVSGGPQDFFLSHSGNYPQSQFDFFPYCGIHRPVLIHTIPATTITDVTVRTDIVNATDGRVTVDVNCDTTGSASARIQLNGHGASSTTQAVFSNHSAQGVIDVPEAALWSPATPCLYDLIVNLVDHEVVIDSYSLKIGIRTIEVEGEQLLLNGQPVYLKGFGRHEDFPISGRGYVPAVMVKDYALLTWMGANSFRTCHYPYSEQMLDLADRLGFLVIDETPAVGLYFRKDGLEKRTALCRQYVTEMVQRDKNHPCVIIWSLANEPHTTSPEAGPFFEQLYLQTKELDPSRPVTLVSFLGMDERAFEFCDLICLNRYLGWYSQSGELDKAVTLLSTELDELHKKFSKPVMLAEFGADAIPGHHAQPPEMFSEEYQADLIERYIELLRQKPYVVGEHIWNMCDFKTAQGITRAGSLNHKGVFTRDRRPKLAAHRLRSLWQKDLS